ncbi:hypothetical protein PENSPDRAFT_736767 [Peniophora sp. CONT]|nr:hypothetical protein PENSPDRAFT_736767 [Peniophora sp. CONT]
MSRRVLPLVSRNAMAPLNRLPDELICEVFLVLAASSRRLHSEPSSSWLAEICGVCHRWRELALALPSLWASFVGSYASQGLTDISFDRSGSAPLRFTGRWQSEAHVHALSVHQLQLVRENLARTELLVHEAKHDWTKTLRRTTLPSLVEASLADYHKCYTDTLSCHAPLLRKLNLCDLFIPFVSPNLRFLRLDSETVLPVNTSRLLLFLQRTQRLEKLLLLAMPSDLDNPDFRLPSDVRSQLPHLRQLCIRGRSSLVRFWKRLHIPTHTDVCITVVPPDAETIFHPRSVNETAVKAILSVFNPYLSSPSFDSLALHTSRVLDFGFELLPHTRSDYKQGTPCYMGGTPEETHAPFSLKFEFHLKGTEDMDHSDIDIPRPRFSRFTRYATMLLPLLDTTNLHHLDFVDLPLPVTGYGYDSEGYDSEGSEPEEPYPVFDPSVRGIDAMSRNLLCRSLVRFSAITHATVSYETQGSDFTLLDGLFPRLQHLTVVDFPCASFPSRERYDKALAERGWTLLLDALKKRAKDGLSKLQTLKLAESSSNETKLFRGDTIGWYRDAIGDAYRDAVASVNAPALREVTRWVERVEDERVSVWPHPSYPIMKPLGPWAHERSSGAVSDTGKDD